MSVYCFGTFDKEKEECAYCNVAVECYESSHSINHPKGKENV